MSHRSVVPVSPDVLRWAREASGVTINEAARRVDQPVDILKAWEEGSGKPSIASLRNLAHLYRRPLGVFLLATPPEEPRLPVDFRASATQSQQPLTRETLVAIRHARNLQSVAKEALTTETWRPSVNLTPKNVEEVAQAVRLQMGVTLESQTSWRTANQALSAWRAALERSGPLVLQADLPMPDVRALSIPGDPPVIVLNEHDAATARCFSLFHEYGHLLLGTGGICSPLSTTPFLNQNEERLCNRLAGAVLIPSSALSNATGEVVAGEINESVPDAALRHVADSFRVSVQVIWYRMREGGLVSQPEFQRRWARWASTPMPAKLKTGSTPKIARWQKARWRLGPALIERLLSAEDAGAIETSDLLRYIDVPLEDLPRLVGGTRSA